mmetsp:Transcript_75530/g.149300  ORF Transcript_75530/g.149300 Transcript_75530/m.149300 type:complete len:241 (-) Transcript_75530:58-780(-)
MSAQVARSVRLTTLLRGFGLCAQEFAATQPKAVIAAVRTEYHRLAKEQHPDHVPEVQKAEATKRFIQLQGNFEEVVKLLEAGVRPAGTVASSAESSGGSTGARYVHPQYVWPTHVHQAYEDSKPQEFSLMTRVKGASIILGSLVGFFFGLREFLVWSAGTTFAWNPPQNSGSLFRRFRDDWASEVKQTIAQQKEQEAVKAKVLEKKAPAKKERGVDEFYQKRGIRNEKRKTQPRGLGPSL